MPPETFARIGEYDAILLGAMGLPDVRWPSGVEMAPQLDLRERLDLYCGLRPVYLYHSGDTPLRDREAGAIDILLIRESTEGLFWSGKNRVERRPRKQSTRCGSRVAHPSGCSARRFNRPGDGAAGHAGG